MVENPNIECQICGHPSKSFIVLEATHMNGKQQAVWERIQCNNCRSTGTKLHYMGQTTGVRWMQEGV